jgi:hypothetical protein
MSQLPPEVRSDLKEPYPNFFVTLHQLMLGQIEFTRLRILIIKVVIGIIIAIVVINILICLLSIAIPLVGASILLWIQQQISQLSAGGYGG